MRKGITAIELVVVLSILGVLMAIAMPVYKQFAEQSKVNACQANRIMVVRQMELLRTQMPDLTIEESYHRIMTDDTASYFDKIPACPSQGNTPWCQMVGSMVFAAVYMGP